jgi:alpha-galactosidase
VAQTQVSGTLIAVSDGALALSIAIDDDGIPRITRLMASPADGPAQAAAAVPAVPSGLPLADLLTPGTGRRWSGTRYAESVLGLRLRYDGHADREDGVWREICVRLADVQTGLRTEVFLRLLTGQGAVRAWTRITNDGHEPVTIDAVSSFLCGGLPVADGIGSPDDLDVMWAENEWLAEGRWQHRGFRDAVPDTDRVLHPANPRQALGFTSTGSWSSGTYLPMGALVNRRTGQCWAWQVEHNGAWHWQTGEAAGGAYVALLGPTAAEHQWQQTLAPGDSFTTVPVGLAVSGEGFEGAIGRLTAYRRAARRPHEDHQRLPVIFNDYMNTLMGDPTTDKLLPLISAAARAGAEYFCVDAGWYDGGAGWWDSAGDWVPAPSRFPGGFAEVIDHIRAEGMVAGVWLEPEVVGVHTRAARALPDDAFFHRAGVRVVEHGRYHLDLRHPAAADLLDKATGYLIGELGIGYLKLDYNIRADQGTDLRAESAGSGLLGHNRAYLGWLDRLLDRYPALVIENCSSGGMRTDYALLSRLQIQSTSDQQDFCRYPVIAASAPAGMTPEQAGVWAYPQPGFSPDEIALTLCNALLGRIHLSGHLDRMSEQQREQVARAVQVYKQIRPEIAAGLPFWPLGLPRWDDPWVALGIRAPGRSYIAVWHRGDDDAADATASLPIAHLRGTATTSVIMFSGPGAVSAQWDAGAGALSVSLPSPPAACLVALR